MSKPWPPPPDLESLKELVAAADAEGFIANDGAPADEYDGEAAALHEAIGHLPTTELVVANLLPILNLIWSTSFSLEGAALQERGPALLALAQQIERFFGPQAQPQVRGA